MKLSTLFLLIGIFLTANLTAQPKLPEPKDLENFYNSTTYILLNDNIFGTYNNRIKTAAKNYWTLTPIRYINKQEFKTKKKFPLASFILETSTHFEGQEDLGVFTSLSILGGHRTGNIDLMPDLATLPLAYDDVDYDEYDYKIGLALKFMQNHINWVNDNPNMENKLLFDHYRKAQIPTKNKTLYMRKNEPEEDLRTLSAIKEVYSGKVVFATAEEIEEVIDSGDKDALVLHLVAPATDRNKTLCIKMIISVADANLHYFDFHQINKRRKPGNFLKSDFKAIEIF